MVCVSVDAVAPLGAEVVGVGYKRDRDYVGSAGDGTSAEPKRQHGDMASDGPTAHGGYISGEGAAAAGVSATGARGRACARKRKWYFFRAICCTRSAVLERLQALDVTIGRMESALASLGLHVQSKGMSSASSVHMMGALRKRKYKLRTTLVHDLPGFAEVATPAFGKWADYSNEEKQATPALLQHFQDYFKPPAGTHVVDVHECGVNLFDSVVAVVANEKTVFSGKTDGIVAVTKNVAKNDAASAAAAAVAVIELKTEAALKGKRAACKAQTVLEVLGASHLCGYPVIGVLTDMVTCIHVFWREGKVMHDYTGVDGKPLTLAEANGVLALLLPIVVKAREKVMEAALRAVIEEEEDDDDGGSGGGDDASGGDDGSGGGEDEGDEGKGEHDEGKPAGHGAGGAGSEVKGKPSAGAGAMKGQVWWR